MAPLKSARFVEGYTEAVHPKLSKSSVHHEYDERGNHRLTYHGRVGSWETYANIAYIYLQDEDVYLAATTDYYYGELPEVFEILPIKKHDLEERDFAPAV